MDNTLSKFKNLISKGKIDETIQHLIDFFKEKDNSYYNQIVLISARYSSIKESIILDVVKNDTTNILRQKIILSLLNLIDDYTEYIELMSKDFYSKKIDDLIEVIGFDIIDKPEQICNFYSNWKYEQKGYYPIFDFKFYNKSDDNILITNIHFELERISYHYKTLFTEALQISWDYNLLIDTNKKRENKEFKAAQLIYPNSTDRFIVTLGGNSNEFEYINYKCNIVLSLHNNEQLSFNDNSFSMYLPDNQKTIVLQKTIRNKP